MDNAPIGCSGPRVGRARSSKTVSYNLPVSTCLAARSMELTIEQFDQLPEEEGVRYELDEGELIVMPTARPRHNLVRDNIADPLRRFVRERGLGEVFRETDVQLSPHTVRIPDAAFVTAERMKQLDLDRRIAEA